MSLLYDGINPKTKQAPNVNLVYSVGFSDASLSFCLREQRQHGWKSSLTTRGSYPSFQQAYEAVKAEAEASAEVLRQCGQAISVGLVDMQVNARALQSSWGLNKQQAVELAAVVAGMVTKGLWSEVRSDFFESQNELTLPEDDNKLAQISIDAWKGQDDNEKSEVIARVILSRHGDIIVDYHDNAARLDLMAQSAIADAKAQLTEYYTSHSIEFKAEDHNAWLDSRPYLNELLEILKENGIEYDDDAQAVADAIIDLIDASDQPVEKKQLGMPDELVVRMAHYAGELEVKGEIRAPDWDNLCAAIRDAIQIYYDTPSETNPFHIEDVMERVLRERFPAEPHSIRDVSPVLKDIVALVCTHETRFGVDHYVSLHPDSETALAAVDSVKIEADFDETDVCKQYFDFVLEHHTLDVSKLPDHKERETLTNVLDGAKDRATPQKAARQGRPQPQSER